MASNMGAHTRTKRRKEKKKTETNYLGKILSFVKPFCRVAMVTGMNAVRILCQHVAKIFYSGVTGNGF